MKNDGQTNSSNEEQIREVLETLADTVGATTTRDYRLKHGLWEGLSIDHVEAINLALQQILTLETEKTPS